ncbi:UNVERIFIED_CONTAM: hypothetical protein PYX00_007739 [Menopon gallinae]|uniref:Replication protein A subunit n=1 Tax=Menopon gallinae TaxID=328185 RepID=A0AAW2HK54_9NEOP
MTIQLSEGALEVIMSGGNYDRPIMQVLASKKLATPSIDRFRLLISDGKNAYSFAMVATQLNHLVTGGELSEFTIVQINRYVTSTFNNPDKDKRVMVIVEMEILKKGSEVGIKLGNPQPLDISKLGENAEVNNKKPAVSIPQPKPIANQNQIKVTQAPSPVHPISSLNPYQNKWSIKARVTNKQPPRTYRNAKGEGKLFSVVFTDDSGEIKCTGFNSVVDKLADLLELNKVYIVSNCTIKPANKKFTQADYEMTFHEDSLVMPCEDDSNLPSNLYNFTPISKIGELEVDSIIDVIGVAKSAGEVQTLVARSTGKELKKREVILVEPSKSSIALTLWGQQAVDFDASNCPVVAAKSVKVGEFMGGKSVSTLMSSTLQLDPDIQEAYSLRAWYDGLNGADDFVSISARAGGQSSGGGGSNWMFLGELATQGIGRGDKADYFSCVVNILMVKSENCVYKACPQQECKKKMTDMGNGMYRCEKCARDFDNFSYRLLLNAQISDYTGSTWATVFHDEAQKLLGVDAQVIGSGIDEKLESYKNYFTKLNFKKYQMRLRTKMEAYNDEKRLKSTVVNLEPLDYKAYTRRLLEQYKERAGMVPKPSYK